MVGVLRSSENPQFVIWRDINLFLGNNQVIFHNHEKYNKNKNIIISAYIREMALQAELLGGCQLTI